MTPGVGRGVGGRSVEGRVRARASRRGRVPAPLVATSLFSLARHAGLVSAKERRIRSHGRGRAGACVVAHWLRSSAPLRPCSWLSFSLSAVKPDTSTKPIAESKSLCSGLVGGCGFPPDEYA
jgi:hypothetical protein